MIVYSRFLKERLIIALFVDQAFLQQADCVKNPEELGNKSKFSWICGFLYAAQEESLVCVAEAWLRDELYTKPDEKSVDYFNLVWHVHQLLIDQFMAAIQLKGFRPKNVMYRCAATSWIRATLPKKSEISISSLPI